jgi:hypothetical protein
MAQRGRPRKPLPDEIALPQALAPMKPPADALPIETEAIQSLNRAIQEALDSEGRMDLSRVPDALLLEDDPTRRARLTLPLSYLRLIHYLRMRAESPEIAFRQAQLALKYIEHVEDSPRDLLRLGHRTVADANLDRAVIEYRREALRVIKLRDREEPPIWQPRTLTVVDASVINPASPPALLETDPPKPT